MTMLANRRGRAPAKAQPLLEAAAVEVELVELQLEKTRFLDLPFPDNRNTKYTKIQKQLVM